MPETKNTKQLITRHGATILEGVAESVAMEEDAADALADACHDFSDWACVLAALGAWDNGNARLNEVLDCIAEVAGEFCSNGGSSVR